MQCSLLRRVPSPSLSLRVVRRPLGRVAPARGALLIAQDGQERLCLITTTAAGFCKIFKLLESEQGSDKK